MKLIILLTIIFLFGCETIDKGSRVDKLDFDLINYDTGLKVQNITNNIIFLDHFNYSWEFIQRCSGLSSGESPFIVVVNKIEGDINGKYYYGDKVIVIEYEYSSRGKVLSHELLHFLLHVNNLKDQSIKHKSYLFKKCVPNTIIGKEKSYVF